MKGKIFPTVKIAIILYIFLGQISYAQGQWLIHYRAGLKQMQAEQWDVAIANFKEAIKIRPEDTDNIRIAGGRGIPYFPHRELGICYYYLRNFDLAEKELKLSLSQASSTRAKDFLEKTNKREIIAAVQNKAGSLNAEAVKKLRPEILERIEADRLSIRTSLRCDLFWC